MYCTYNSNNDDDDDSIVFKVAATAFSGLLMLHCVVRIPSGDVGDDRERCLYDLSVSVCLMDGGSRSHSLKTEYTVTCMLLGLNVWRKLCRGLKSAEEV